MKCDFIIGVIWELIGLAVGLPVYCFAATLAKLENGELLTGDKEFKEVENEVGILWIT